MVSLRTDINRDETVLRCINPWLAPGYEIRSRSADGVFDEVRQKRCQNQTDGEAEDGDV